MGTWHHVSTLALRQLLNGACEAVGILAARESSEVVVAFLSRHFSDHSQRLAIALRQANERAWQTLEIALAGESLWDRCRVLLAPRDQQAFLREVRLLLDATPLAGLPGHGPEFRRECLRQLRAARKAGALTGDAFEPLRLAEEVGALARFGDPHALLDAEQRLIEQAATDLHQGGYAGLAQLVVLRPESGPPLLVAAARYFFRRQVEEDRELFQGLAFAQLDVCYWDLANGRILRRLQVPKAAHANLSFSPDGRAALTASPGYCLSLWDLGSGRELRRFTGHLDEVRALTFSPDAARAVSGGADMSLRVWDVAGGKELACLRGHRAAVTSVAVSPDGRYALSGSEDHGIRLWKLPDV